MITIKKIIGQPQFIKEVNIDIIESIIAEKGPVSKPEIAKLTSLSLPTVNKTVEALMEENRVKVSGVLNSGIGRKAQLYIVNEDSGCILALYFMNDNYICSAVNAIGEIIHKCTMPVDASSRETALMDTFRAVDELSSHTSSRIKAIGIGVPGVVKSNGTISNIPSIPAWEGINLKELVEERYKVSVYVENDVKLTTVGYYHDELRQQYDSMIYIYVGQGIGSGIIINKRLYKGYQSFAGELAYMIIEKTAGQGIEYTKAKGLLEQKVCTLLNSIKSSGTEEERKHWRDKLSELLALLIINMICILNPEAVVVSGEVADERFIENLRSQVGYLLDKESLPVFLNNTCSTTGISGIINMCMSNISSRYQLVKEKGI